MVEVAEVVAAAEVIVVLAATICHMVLIDVCRKNYNPASFF